MGKPPLLKSALRIFGATALRTSAALAAILLLSTSIHAQSLYTAQVEFDPRQGQSRADAYKAALRIVLFRVSGSQLSDNRVLMEELFPDPSDYVVQFRPGEGDTLWVSFDGDAVEDTLRRSGQLVWGGDRPPTLVIIAIDRGNGERELLSAGAPGPRFGKPTDAEAFDEALRERVLTFAEDRGLPVILPLLDAEDIATFTFADVWGGFAEPVLAAGRRYDVNSVLVGRIRSDSSRLDRWTYFFAGEQFAFTGEPETALSQVAERLAVEYAIGGDEPLRSVSLSVSGVDSVESYGALQVLLRDVPVIEEIQLIGVDGDRIDYRLTAYGGAPRVARALRLGGLIEEDRFNLDDAAGVPRDPRFVEQLYFFYNP